MAAFSSATRRPVIWARPGPALGRAKAGEGCWLVVLSRARRRRLARHGAQCQRPDDTSGSRC